MIQSLEYIQIEPTTRCNYTCGFCAGRHMQQQDLDFETFKTLLDSTQNLKHIELQGEGEPLMHPQFFDMIAYARLRFPSAAISFITNGSLFTTDNIAKIIAANIHTILISIESADEAEFQQIRGGKLAKVKRGIAELIAQKNALASTLKVGFAVTVLKQTVTQINYIGELYKDLNMDGGINIQPLQGMDCYAQFYTPEMKQSLLGHEDRATLNSLIASDRTVKTAYRSYQAQKSFYSSLFSSIPEYINACAWLENGLYIAADGVAASCCYVKNTQKDGYAPITTSLESILEQRAELSRQLGENKVPAQCQGCGIAYNVINRNKTGHN